MSAAKRSRRRQSPEAKAVSPSALPPSSKRLKTTQTSHVPASTSLAFLVDENARHGRKLEARLTNGVPSSRATQVDEPHAVVAPDMKDVQGEEEVGSSAENAIGISSGEDSSEDSDDDDDDDEGTKEKLAPPPLLHNLHNGHSIDGHGKDRTDGLDVIAGAERAEAGDDQEQVEEDADMEEPSFGEMLQARHPDPIDVHASLANPMADRQALVPLSGDRVLAAPSGTSLTTVLTQALKTNDKDLLESCFHTTDIPTIRSTIQRLQSQHVATLLQRLAERIHKRPGRTGSLLTWVEWSLIAHGGYLATQPEIMQQLKSLSRVIRDRANGLQPLLHLKGKLNLLSAQLELRRSIQAASRAVHGDSEDEDEEGVVYIEGQDEDWSDSDEDAEAEERRTKSKPHSATSRSLKPTDDDTRNGIAQEADDDSSEDEEEAEGLLDIEASETSDDDDDEEDDADSEIDDSGSEEEASDLSDSESDVSDAPAPLPKSLNRRR